MWGPRDPNMLCGAVAMPQRPRRGSLGPTQPGELSFYDEAVGSGQLGPDISGNFRENLGQVRQN